MALTTAFNRLKREIGIKRCIIIDGNVGDVYLNEKKANRRSENLSHGYAQNHGVRRRALLGSDRRRGRRRIKT